MSYAERHIAREVAHLKAAEAVADADRGGAVCRLLASEAERVRAVHAKRLRIEASVSSARLLRPRGGNDRLKRLSHEYAF